MRVRGFRRTMTRLCEVCTERSDPNGDRAAMANTHRVLLDDRVVALCREHARAVRQRGLTTLGALRDAFLESDGGRSLVDRRSPLDRRIFPSRPEGRRMGHDRRTPGSNS